MVTRKKITDTVIPEVTEDVDVNLAKQEEPKTSDFDGKDNYLPLAGKLINSTYNYESIVLTSFIKAKASFGSIKKDRVNPFHKSKYATLDSINTAVDGPLLAEGFAIVSNIEEVNGKSELVSRLLHTSGYFNPVWMESRITLPNTPDFQKLGSALTYARRYNKCALLDVIADEDDDGNASTRITDPQVKRLIALASKHGWSNEEVSKVIQDHGVKKAADLSLSAYGLVCDILESRSVS